MEIIYNVKEPNSCSNNLCPIANKILSLSDKKTVRIPIFYTIIKVYPRKNISIFLKLCYKKIYFYINIEYI